MHANNNVLVVAAADAAAAAHFSSLIAVYDSMAPNQYINKNQRLTYEMKLNAYELNNQSQLDIIELYETNHDHIKQMLRNWFYVTMALCELFRFFFAVISHAERLNNMHTVSEINEKKRGTKKVNFVNFSVIFFGFFFFFDIFKLCEIPVCVCVFCKIVCNYNNSSCEWNACQKRGGHRNAHRLVGQDLVHSLLYSISLMSAIIFELHDRLYDHLVEIEN